MAAVVGKLVLVFSNVTEATGFLSWCGRILHGTRKYAVPRVTEWTKGTALANY